MKRQEIADATYETLRSFKTTYSGILQEDTLLGFGGLNLDSLGCLDLVLKLESVTGITMRTEHLTADALESIGSLIDFLQCSDHDA